MTHWEIHLLICWRITTLSSIQNSLAEGLLSGRCHVHDKIGDRKADNGPSARSQASWTLPRVSQFQIFQMWKMTKRVMFFPKWFNTAHAARKELKKYCSLILRSYTFFFFSNWNSINLPLRYRTLMSFPFRLCTTESLETYRKMISCVTIESYIPQSREGSWPRRRPGESEVAPCLGLVCPYLKGAPKERWDQFEFLRGVPEFFTAKAKLTQRQKWKENVTGNKTWKNLVMQKNFHVHQEKFRPVDLVAFFFRHLEDKEEEAICGLGWGVD